MPRGLSVLLFVLGITYPFVIYFSMETLSPRILALIVVIVLGMRVFMMKEDHASKVKKGVLGSFFVGALGLAGVMAWKGETSWIRWYPVLMSSMMASLFTLSLYNPPSMIERFARMGEKNLPEAAIPYLRKVTQVWILFLSLNAMVAAYTAKWGSWKLWTLYNGFIAYVLMGILLVGEFIVRKQVQKRHAKGV